MTRNTTLDQLPAGSQATVDQLTCSGVERRRMMDLGILPGTRITAEFRSPLGDPVAYRVRGALIALRREQAEQILITCENTGEVEHHDSSITHPTG